MDPQDLVTEMRDLRARVPGVTGTLVAAYDGQLMAADLDPRAGARVNPESVAGMAAASIGIARQVAGLARQGGLGQTVTRAGDGHVAVYPVGDVALLAVLGDERLDVAALHRKSQPALDRIHAIVVQSR